MNSKILALIIVAFLYSGGSLAVGVTDVVPDDLNYITGVAEDSTNPILTISEVYGEDNLMAYPSHDGNAIVDHDPGENVRYFDTSFDFGSQASGQWQINFEVTNSTLWSWSDYHFEFWDASFENPLDVDMNRILFGWENTVVFQNSALDLYNLSFWEPAQFDNGATKIFRLSLNFDQGLPSSFGIRQIATTVPEPSSVALFIIGLAGFSLRRKFV